MNGGMEASSWVLGLAISQILLRGVTELLGTVAAYQPRRFTKAVRTKAAMLHCAFAKI